jgi:hypothetical protein
MTGPGANVQRYRTRLSIDLCRPIQYRQTDVREALGLCTSLGGCRLLVLSHYRGDIKTARPTTRLAAPIAWTIIRWISSGVNGRTGAMLKYVAKVHFDHKNAPNQPICHQSTGQDSSATVIPTLVEAGYR